MASNGNPNYMHNGFDSFSQELIYPHINPDYYLMRPVSNAILRIQRNEAAEEDYELLTQYNVILSPWEANKDTCKSKPIICYLEDPSTGLIYTGTNGINEPQKYCLRHYLQNDADNNYKDCRDVCFQPAHAEIMAVITYFLYTGILSYKELERMFPGTESENGSINFGIVTHESLLKYIKYNDIKLNINMRVYLYGQETCCNNCAQVLLELGVRAVRLSKATHEDEKLRRRQIHSEVTLEEDTSMRGLTRNHIPEISES